MQKYAFVTGGSKGIGESIVKILARDGFITILHFFLDKKRAQKIKKEIEAQNGQVYLINGDLSKIEDIKNIFVNLPQITNKLDLVVNNAGIYFSSYIEEYPLDKIEYTFRVNLIAPFYITQLALPFLRKSNIPQIINISSRLGKEKVVDKSSAYAASKAALIQFTRCCALEFRKYKIRVNAICPGFTNTEINRPIITSKRDLYKIFKNIPLGRIAEPKDIANVVSFLASSKAFYINGESIGVNGGSTLM